MSGEMSGSTTALRFRLFTISAALSTSGCRYFCVTLRLLCPSNFIASLMKLLGHSSLSVTQKYIHTEDDKAAEIVNKRNRKAVVLPDISPDITAHASWIN